MGVSHLRDTLVTKHMPRVIYLLSSICLVSHTCYIAYAFYYTRVKKHMPVITYLLSMKKLFQGRGWLCDANLEIKVASIQVVF